MALSPAISPGVSPGGTLGAAGAGTGAGAVAGLPSASRASPAPKAQSRVAALAAAIPPPMSAYLHFLRRELAVVAAAAMPDAKDADVIATAGER